MPLSPLSRHPQRRLPCRSIRAAEDMSAGLGALNPTEQVEVMGRIPEPTRAGCEMVPDVIGNQSLAAFVLRMPKTTCSTLTFCGCTGVGERNGKADEQSFLTTHRLNCSPARLPSLGKARRSFNLTLPGDAGSKPAAWPCPLLIKRKRGRRAQTLRARI